MQAAGVWKATEGGGGPRRKGDSRCWSSGRSGVSGAARLTAEACTRRGAARPGGGGQGTPDCAQVVAARCAGCSFAGAAPSGAAGDAARQLLRPGLLGKCVRVYVRLLPCSSPCAACTPLARSCVCSARPPARRVCAATQLARGPRPPGRGPGRKSLPTRRARGGGGGASAIRLLLLRMSETWCPQGPLA